MSAAVTGSASPRLPRGVRLRHDEARGEWVLLAPERVFKIDAIGHEILRRCTGEQTLDAIIDDLASTFAAERSRIERDVVTLISDLHAKRMMDL